MPRETSPENEPRLTELPEIRNLAVIPLWSQREPNWAGLEGGLSKWAAYRFAADAENADLIVRRGSRVMVKVQPLRRQLGDLPPLPTEQAGA